MPPTPDEAYERILDLINKESEYTKNMAFRTLSWIFHARRPLKMQELSHAIVVEDGPFLYNDDDHSPAVIVESCQGLITYDESSGVVRFAHATVQEWFSKSNSYKDLPSALYLAQTCLTYLGFDILDGAYLHWRHLRKQLEIYKFGLYAAQFWGWHTKGEAENFAEIQKATLDILANERKRDSILQMEAYANSSGHNISFTEGQTLLHVIAKNGLATICRVLLDGRVNDNDGYMLST
jgi:hypothetical protein